MESLSGKTMTYTMEALLMGWNMAKGNGNLERNSTQEIGNTISLKEKGTSNHHYLSTREKLETDISMERGGNSSTMEIDMRDNILMGNLKVTELTIGAMDLYIKVSLKMD